MRKLPHFVVHKSGDILALNCYGNMIPCDKISGFNDPLVIEKLRSIMEKNKSINVFNEIR